MDKHMDEARNMNALRAGLFKNENKNSSRWARIRTSLMVAIAVMLVMSATMGAAWAYFTTYARAKGSVTLNLGHQEHIDEKFSSWNKTINLTSEPDTLPAYVRVRAFCAAYELQYKCENADSWTQDGDWWYYNKKLEPGKSLSDSGDELIVHIEYPETGDPNMAEGETFNVVIIYESTDVQYDENGNEKSALNADWSRKVDTSRITSTQGGDD